MEEEHVSTAEKDNVDGEVKYLHSHIWSSHDYEPLICILQLRKESNENISAAPS